MIIPVRCFTCNQVIAHLWEKYQEQIQIQFIKDNIPEDSKKRFMNMHFI